MPVNPTIAQSLDARKAKTTPTPEFFTATVVSVDAAMQEVRVVDGLNGPRVKIPPHLVPYLNQIGPGARIRVERIDDEYVGTWFVATQFLPMIGRNISSAPTRTPIPQLAAPANFRIVQIGTQMQAYWDPSAGAVGYELFSNATPSPNGATRLPGMPIQTSAYAWTLDIASGSSIAIVNPGFESGDGNGWTIVPAVTISTAFKHSGNYAAMWRTLSLTFTPLTSIDYAVVAGNSYTVSVWQYLDGSDLTNTLTLKVAWKDAAGSILSTSTAATWTAGIAPDTWHLRSGAVTAPANAVSASIILENTGGVFPGGADCYVDDFALTGTVPVSTTLSYAVRAIGPTGETSGFSTWLLPVQQGAALGPTNADHIQLKPAGSPPEIASSNFVSGSAGFKISPDGIDGKLLMPMTNPQIIKSTTTEVAITNSAAETTIWSFTMPANTLAAGNIVDFVLWGDIANGGAVNNSAYVIYKIKVGATILSTVTPSYTFRNGVATPFSHRCLATIKAITSASQRATMIQENPWLQTFAWGQVLCVGDNTSSIDFSSAQTITVTATMDAAQFDHTYTFRAGRCIAHPAT